MLFILKSRISKLLLLVSILISINVRVMAEGPTCICDDPSLTDEEQTQCYLSEACESYDVPVNGNIWLLFIAGGVAFALGYKKLSPVKF